MGAKMLDRKMVENPEFRQRYGEAVARVQEALNRCGQLQAVSEADPSKVIEYTQAFRDFRNREKEWLDLRESAVIDN